MLEVLGSIFSTNNKITQEERSICHPGIVHRSNICNEDNISSFSRKQDTFHIVISTGSAN
jgi:hypothetical protein